MIQQGGAPNTGQRLFVDWLPGHSYAGSYSAGVRFQALE
jgi:hypothetical protein